MATDIWYDEQMRVSGAHRIGQGKLTDARARFGADLHEGHGMPCLCVQYSGEQYSL